jgi:putative ATP-binding cassette transporter
MYMNKPDNLNRINGKLWARLWAIAKPYWVSEEKKGAIALLVVLVVLRITISRLDVFKIELYSDYMNALSERDSATFYRLLFTYGAVLIFIAPILVSRRFVRDKLGLFWRRWLTNHFLDKYFRDRAYYEINQNGQIDNPDQRISDEVKAFTRTSLGFLLIFIGEFVELISFIDVLWRISINLVIVALGYAGVGTAIAVVVGRKLIPLNFKQLKLEADFRYGLIHVRDNAESIAFYRGEEQESAQVKRKFDKVFNNFTKLINWQRNLEFFTTGYNYVDNIIPVLIMSYPYFAGDIKLGVILKAVIAFRHVLSAFSVIVNQFDDLSAFAAGVNRLETFEEALVAPDEARRNGANIDTTEASQFALEHITLSTPNREKTLVQNVSATVEPGEGLLIMGQSGCGKSSLLRAIAGLWNSGTGRVLRPKLEETLFLPQRPYMILGTLRQQLLYPHTSREVEENKLHEVLVMVNLADLPERVGGFDAELDWADILSLGEQQRLAFARLLLTAPKYAILDESTSALDIKNEQRLYQHLQEKGTTLISVGHRPSLLAFHHQVLELEGGGKWRLVPAEGYTSAAYGMG